MRTSTASTLQHPHHLSRLDGILGYGSASALEEIAMKTTVRKKKGGARSKTLKEEKRDIGRSLKAFGKRVTKALKK